MKWLHLYRCLEKCNNNFFLRCFFVASKYLVLTWIHPEITSTKPNKNNFTNKNQPDQRRLVHEVEFQKQWALNLLDEQRAPVSQVFDGIMAASRDQIRALGIPFTPKKQKKHHNPRNLQQDPVNGPLNRSIY